MVHQVAVEIAKGHCNGSFDVMQEGGDLRYYKREALRLLLQFWCNTRSSVEGSKLEVLQILRFLGAWRLRIAVETCESPS